MKKILLLFLLILNFNLVISQNSTSYEAEIINEYKKDSINYDFLASLSVIDSNTTKQSVEKFKETLNTLINNLPPEENSDRKEIKRIKKIYDIIHKSLFIKYEEIAYFPQIFEDGTYNCVTATAIYVYVFDKLKIPYIIKENPGHVFLIAYPKKHKIILETTAPGSYGFSIPKDSDVEEVVEELIKLKLVTQQEVDNTGIGKTYMNYFYGKESLDKSALVGMQYYNKGLTYYMNEDFKKAQINIQKSLTFYPYALSKFLNKSLVILNLDKTELNTLENVKKVAEAFSMLEYDKDFNDIDIKHYLYKITDHDDNDLTFIEKTIPILSNFKNKQLNNNNKTFLYEYLTRKNGLNENADEVLRISDSLLKINPKNKFSKESVRLALYQKLRLLPYSEDNFDLIDNYEKKYTFIKGDKKIDTYKAFLFSKGIEENLSNNKIDFAEKQLDSFHQLIAKLVKNDDLLIPQDNVTYIYVKAGKYYYRNDLNKKALDILNKGLELFPEDREIKKIISWVDDKINNRY